MKSARRFCWRERTEKLNWRMLKALDVADVVRRGDPALLEPYALHLTFARLPAETSTSTRDPTDRDAWFIVRVFQLAMEYLLFMRSRDSDVLGSLGQELHLCERERDELATRAQKWRARSRSGEKQVEKLHQVLQNIAKLLQIHGASPSAVSTIETLLTELITERQARQRKRAALKDENTDVNEDDEVCRPRVQEARVCAYCGKLFSSADYLEKHVVRRHSGETGELKLPPEPRSQCIARDEVMSTSKANSAAPMTSEQAMQSMVLQIQQALHAHEENLRSLAHEETRKIEQVYEQFHVEMKFAEELKTSRLQSEKQQKEAQCQLESVCQQRQDAADELADLKEQIQFLTLKKKMMGTTPIPTPVVALQSSDANSKKDEVKRLHQTLEMVSTELTSARDELAKLQTTHLNVLREKQELTQALASARDGADAAEFVPAVKLETSSQTEQWVVVEVATQTDQWVMIEDVTQTEQCIVVEEAMQTDMEESQPLDQSEREGEILAATGALKYEETSTQTTDDQLGTTLASMDAEVQVTMEVPVLLVKETSPANSAVASPHSSVSTPSTPAEAPSSSELVKDHGGNEACNEDIPREARIPDCIQQFHSEDVLDAITTRAERAANETSSGSALLSGSDRRRFSSLPRRKFVLSHFQHDENLVRERVCACLQQLRHVSQRYGVSAKTAWMSDDNLQTVQQALHGHLEVLPADVLSKMVDCENAVNAMIAKEWVPREKARQQALKRFKVETHAKSLASQELVKQAMAAFGVPSKLPLASNGESGGEDSKEIGESAASAADFGESAITQSESSVLAAESSSDEKPLAASSDRRYSDSNRLTVIIEEEKAPIPATQQAGQVEVELVSEAATSDQTIGDENLRDESFPARSFKVSSKRTSALGNIASEQEDNDIRVDAKAESTTLAQTSLTQERIRSVQVASFTPHPTMTAPQQAEDASLDPSDSSTVHELAPTRESLASGYDRSHPRVTAVRQHERSDVHVASEEVKEKTANDTQSSSQEVGHMQDSTDGGNGKAVKDAPATETPGESNLEDPSADEITCPLQEAEEDERDAALESESQDVVPINIGSEDSFDEEPTILNSMTSLEWDCLPALGAVTNVGVEVNQSVPLVESSETAFDTSIPSLGTESVGGAAGVSSSTIVMGLNDFEDDGVNEVSFFSAERGLPAAAGQGDTQRLSPHGQLSVTPRSVSPSPNENMHATTTIESNDVMSFDDSDIEEVILT